MSRNDESEWSDWGSWNLSKTYSRYYRQRQDVNGNIETMWAIEIDASQRQEAGEENETGPSNSASNSEYASTKSDTQVGAFERPEDEMGYGCRVEPSQKFQPGAVFKVLWPEVEGQALEGTPTFSDRHRMKNDYVVSVNLCLRHFIVIANDRDHCQCVPILTYGGKACAEKGVMAKRHGMVYDYRKRPETLRGEPVLGFPPVRLNIEVERETLAKESRINYSKIVTVEYSMRVFFMGNIHLDDYPTVQDAVNLCWEQKIFEKKHIGLAQICPTNP